MITHVLRGGATFTKITRPDASRPGGAAPLQKVDRITAMEQDQQIAALAP